MDEKTFVFPNDAAGWANGLGGGLGGGILGFLLGLFFGNGYGGFGGSYSIGVDLESETPAYISGDSARELADVVCHFGCSRCN